MNKALVYEKVFAETRSSVSITLTRCRKKMFSLRLYMWIRREGCCLSAFEELVEKTAHISSTWKLERFSI